MKIEGIVWLRDIVEKLAWKHQVEPYEVEEVFANQPKIRFVEKGKRTGELVNFFDNHDFGNYLEELPEVDFEIV